jgi:hypothetical protein
VERPCEACGKPMTVQRATKRFCSSTCRVRNSQGSVVPFVPPAEPVQRDGSLVGAVRAELKEVGRAESALGVAALVLAARIDSGQEPGSAVSGLNRELRATLAEATRGTVKSSVASMRDELAARRRQA